MQLMEHHNSSFQGEHVGQWTGTTDKLIIQPVTLTTNHDSTRYHVFLCTKRVSSVNLHNVGRLNSGRFVGGAFEYHINKPCVALRHNCTKH